MKMEPRASGLRYVVLRHTGYGEDHFDLMFEVSPTDPLMTLRSPVWPIVAEVRLTPLNEHRREYLTYEGPISGNRGEVKRVAGGIYDLAGDGVAILITFTSGTHARPIIIEPDGFCRPQ
jgi:hypothetical protein